MTARMKEQMAALASRALREVTPKRGRAALRNGPQRAPMAGEHGVAVPGHITRPMAPNDIGEEGLCHRSALGGHVQQVVDKLVADLVDVPT